MELSEKQLQKAAKEFNKVVPLADEKDNPTPVDLKSKELEKNLFTALKYIEEGDEFSKFTDAVFNELKFRHEPKPVVKSKGKSTKEVDKNGKKLKKPVEVGTTVELDPDNDNIKKGKEMKKGKGNAKLIATILDKKVGKDALVQMIADEDAFDKKTKKALGKVTNFMSLKKQMLEVFDEDEVKEVKATMPKPVAKPKVKKDSPLVTSIKEAVKVKQLKKIAKSNDQFNWKTLKVLDFDDMQKAMLSGSKPMVKVKMIPNPLIAEIEGFKKVKKLVKWAKENDNHVTKTMKKMDLADLQEALIASVPAKIEGKNGGKRTVVNHIDQEARKARIEGLVDTADNTRKEIHIILKEEFPEEGTAHTNSNILSECKSTALIKEGPNVGKQRWEINSLSNIGRLVVEDKNGYYTWADTKVKTKKEKKNKKDKKGKKGKK